LLAVVLAARRAGVWRGGGSSISRHPSFAEMAAGAPFAVGGGICSIATGVVLDAMRIESCRCRGGWRGPPLDAIIAGG